ncbi:MAG: YdeI/OmpD-associated family protein [Gemmatimonadaceae bacterium]
MSPTSRRNTLASLEQVYVADRAAWRRWLEAHHATSPGIWLVFDKKSSRADRLAYGDAVEEALCYGWIDSTVRTLDDARYVQLMAPRKPKSTWSRSNKVRVERLTEQGLMAEPGLASIERAKANGSWASLDAVEALVVPDDLTRALRALPGAATNFAAFSPSARKGYLHWISQAVRPETRAHRVAHVARFAASNQKSRHFAPVAVPAAGVAAHNAAKPTRAKAAKSAKSAKVAESAKSVKSVKSAKPATRAPAAKRRSR